MDFFSYIKRNLSDYKGIIMRSGGIKVREVINSSYCVSKDDGDRLREVISKELDLKGSAKVDFSGIQIFASPFMSTVFGKLIRDLGLDQFEEKIDLVHITQSGYKLINRIKENYQKGPLSEEGQKKLNSILTEELAEI